MNITEIQQSELSYTDEEANYIENNPILITLSGHTCVGKTEWLSKLLDAEVGEISPLIDTTKTIVWKSYTLPGCESPYIKISDVPGHQFSDDIFEKAKEELGPRPKARQMVKFVEKHKDEENEYQPDIKLLEHYLSCDVILYLVDCQNEPEVKIENEFELIRRLGRPVIAVLNFSKENNGNAEKLINEWKELFKQEGARAVIQLDAFYKNPVGINELGEQLVFNLRNDDIKCKFMEKYWLDHILLPEEERLDASVKTLAEFLINAAAYRKCVNISNKSNERSEVGKAKKDSNIFFRSKYIDAVKDLLSKYPKCTASHIEDEDALLSSKAHEKKRKEGPFSGKPLKLYPKSLARGASIGGGIGLLIDVLDGGTTLGVPTVSFMLIGAGLDAGITTSVRKTKFSNLGARIEIFMSDKALEKYMIGLLSLTSTLRCQGMSSINKSDIQAHEKSLIEPNRVLEKLKEIRNKHTWSSWVSGSRESKQRNIFAVELSSFLREILEQSGNLQDRRGTLIELNKRKIFKRLSATFRRS